VVTEGPAEVGTSSMTTKQMWAQTSPSPKDTVCLGSWRNWGDGRSNA